MLVDRIRHKPIAGSILVVGCNRPADHDRSVARLREKYATAVEIHYLPEMFAQAGPNMRQEIRRQVDRLKQCVEDIEGDLMPWKTDLDE